MFLRTLIVPLFLVVPFLFAPRAEAAPGALDGSFGTAGKLIAPIGSADDEAFAVAIDGLGRILVAGSAWNGTDLDFALARFTATGAPDPSFGAGGVVVTPIGPATDAARAIAIDGSGRILVAGQSADGLGQTTFALARYDDTGTLDPLFGTGGAVTTAFGSGDAEARAMVVDASARIVLAGTATAAGDTDFALARYDGAGTLDASFGGGGTVTTAFGPSSDDEANAVMVDASDRILVAGWSDAAGAGNRDFALARYDDLGVLDGAFGTGGLVTLAPGTGDDELRALAIDTGTNIVAAGVSRHAGTADDAVVARFDGAGDPDPGFGSGGVAFSEHPGDDSANALVLEPSGRIVVAGATTSDFELAAFTSGGVLDAAFGSGGLVTTSFGAAGDVARAATGDASGRIVVAGSTDTGTDLDVAVARYLDGCGDGEVDAGEQCDDGNGASGDCCSPTCTFEAAGSTCRASAGDCDPEETCTGSGGSCPADTRTPDGTECRAAAGACDLAESCDGSSATCPSDARKASGALCRTSLGECDPAELCDGSSAACPADVREPAGAACTDDGETCSDDLCDGSSAACTHPAANAGVQCRASTGGCDVAEHCDGVVPTCPADTLRPAGFTCRTAAGECDQAEACDGADAACPVDTVQSSGTACTDDGQPCTSDVCNGSSTTCTHPAGHAGTICRAAAGTCDVAESCNGSSTTCPADALQPASFTCRSAAGECDDAESCSGSSAACPADAVKSSGIACTDDGEACTNDVCDGASAGCTHPAGHAGLTCRAAADVCDVAETCNGTATTCPVDAFRPSSFSCRSAAGECDLAESCTGTGAACPANAFRGAGTACTDDGNVCTADVCNGSGSCMHPAGNAGVLCRAAVDVCDLAETCNGTSTSCPVNAFRPSTFTCRSASGECDIAESCTGIAPSCPVNVFKPFDAACTADVNPCTSDRCDGSGTCTHPPANAGTVCRASGGACDVAETCDGASVTCPADSGTPDSDADATCDGLDACTNAGHGQDFKPRPNPKLALQRINDNVNPGDDQLKFQGVFDLAAGESFASFDPSLTGVRVLLLNQFGGTELDVALPGGTYHGAGTRGWKANGSRTRWKYADKTTDGMLTTAYAGIYEVQVSDRDRRTPREVQVKVGGRFGSYPVVALDSPVRMIVVLGGQPAAIDGMCGETAFVAADCTFNNIGTSLSCRM